MWRFCKYLMLALAIATMSVGSALAQGYRVGVVPQFEARQLQSTWEPLLAALSEHTGMQLTYSASASIPVFEQRFMAGEFDIVYMNPYHYLKGNTAQGYLPLVRDHDTDLQGILVVRKDGPIKKLADLDNKVIAFPAPNALGASLLMRAELISKHGLRFTPDYVKNHQSVYLNVALGQAAAGGGIQKTFDKEPAEVRSMLTVIYQTSKMPPHPLAVHPRVAKGDRDKLRQAVLSLGQTVEGRALLSSVPIKKVGEATHDDYAPLLNLGLEKYYVQE